MSQTKQIYFFLSFRYDDLEEISSAISSSESFLGIEEPQMKLTERRLEVSHEDASDLWSVGSDESCRAFFSSRSERDAWFEQLNNRMRLERGEIEEVDYNAAWVQAFSGVEVEPFWSIRALSPDRNQAAKFSDHTKTIFLNLGAGFGSGTHATTALCLSAIGAMSLDQKTVLDFGSGSGILSIAAAKLGAHVVSVEIDPMALENAIENASHNQVSSRIQFFTQFAEPRSFDFVVANILSGVLKQFSDVLCAWSKNGVLVLSGILEDEAQEIENFFSTKFRDQNIQKVAAITLKEGWASIRFS